MSRSTTWTETAPAKYGEFANLGEVVERLKRHGTKVTSVTGNIGDQKAVAEMKRKIEADLGDVHVLVNCAGGDIGAKGGKPNPNNALDIELDDITRADRKQSDRHDAGLPGLRAADEAARRAAPSSTSPRRRPISAARPRSSIPRLKAAVVHYTRCLAKELMDDGVRINAVSPGATKTARFQATRTVDPERMDSSQQIAEPLCRAGRDRRGGGVPRRPARAVHQRPGAPRRRRVYDFSGVMGWGGGGGQFAAGVAFGPEADWLILAFDEQ